MAASTRQRFLGLLAMTLTVTVWAGFALSTRWIALSALTPVDVALIRFSVPVVLFSFWLGKAVRDVRRAPWAASILIIVGAGMPFFLTSALGGMLSSATMVGVVIPGSAPLFVALIGRVVWGRRLSRQAVTGLAAIILGVYVLAASAPAGIGPLAFVVLIVAALLWALYTLGLQGAGLHPISATLLLCIPSLAGAGTILATRWGESHLAIAPLGQILAFMAIQGVGVGAIASLSYAAAIRTLGPGTASSIGALSPVLVTALAAPIFGEVVTTTGAVAILLVITGVMIVNSKKPIRKKEEEHALEPV